MVNLFFAGKREQFFRPLTHGDRECCAALLRSLYDRVHGPNADYSEALTRELVVGMVFQALAEPAIRAAVFTPGTKTSAEEERAYAGELVRKLKEHGWLDDYKDPIDLKPTLKMTRAGKEVAEVLSNLRLPDLGGSPNGTSHQRIDHSRAGFGMAEALLS